MNRKEFKGLTDTIFALGEVGQDEGLSIIHKSVKKYSNDQNKLLLRNFLVSSYCVERKENDMIDNSQPIKIGQFIYSLSTYAIRPLSLLELINATSSEAICKEFIGNIKSIENDDTNNYIQETLQNALYDYLKCQQYRLQSISYGDIFDYDSLSRRILFTCFGDGGDSVLISNALERLHDSIKDLRIKTNCIDHLETEERNEVSDEEIKRFISNFKPIDIKRFLDQRMVGQEEAKEAAALFLYNHCIRLLYPDLNRQVVLFYGPSGCGKTGIWRALTEISPTPIMILDASAITSRGFQGADLTEILRVHRRAIKRGICVCDEFDKLIIPSHSAQGDDVSAAIQASFLKIWDNKDKTVDERGKEVHVEDVDFVCTGAFIGINNTKPTSPIGFNRERDNVYTNCTTNIEQFIAFGMLPELAGRISNFVELKSLRVEDYYKILTNKNVNPVEQISKQYEVIDGISLNVDDDAKKLLSEFAYRSGLGVRGMVSLIQSIADKQFINACGGSGDDIFITSNDVLQFSRKSL